MIPKKYQMLKCGLIKLKKKRFYTFVVKLLFMVASESIFAGKFNHRQGLKKPLSGLGLQASLLAIAADSTHEGYASARTIISFVTGIRYPEVIILPDTSGSNPR